MSAPERKHVLMISLDGYGHIIPTVSLAQQLLPYHKITFAVNAFMLEHIRRKGEFPPGFENVVDVIGYDDGIAPGTSEDIGLMETWMKGPVRGVPNLRQLLRDMPARNARVPAKTSTDILPHPYQIGEISAAVDLVIGDIWYAEPMAVLAERAVPYYLFNCSAIGPFLNVLYITPNTPVVEMDELEAFLLLRPESEGPQIPVGRLIKDLALCASSHLELATGCLVNSFREFEAEAFVEISKDLRMQHLNFYFIGPLMPHAKAVNEEQHVLEQSVKRWLDQKPDGSVIYVSFGSASLPSESRIREASKALAILGNPFIFSLREHLHHFVPEELRALARKTDLNSAGLLLSWAPQKVVLGHPGVGVFVSHCGWNSTLETVFNGKPVVGWPCFGDQLENALRIQEVGMGRSLIPREAASDCGRRQDIQTDAIVEAIKEAQSERCSSMAKKWQRKFTDAVHRGGASSKELDQFLKNISGSATVQ